LLDLTAVSDDDVLGRRAVLRSDGLDLLDDIESLRDRSEDDVLTVEPLRLGRAEEELRSVGAGSGVGHREDARTGVLQLKIFIGELRAIDRLAAGAVAASEVAALAHETRNDAVELRSLR